MTFKESEGSVSGKFFPDKYLHTSLILIPSALVILSCVSSLWITSVTRVLQVQMLTEMGFNDAQVRQALQMCNNDVNTATNFLLQHS